MSMIFIIEEEKFKNGKYKELILIRCSNCGKEFYKSKTGQNPGTNIRMHFLKSLQDHFSLEVKGTLQ